VSECASRMANHLFATVPEVGARTHRGPTWIDENTSRQTFDFHRRGECTGGRARHFRCVPGPMWQ
jgi:hypothetical protein